ncbi:MAG: hypothetical protein J2P30_28145 [Actinobacteria bacterium]|nr:hypothetical protein [Actinomycetota bacterium]
MGGDSADPTGGDPADVVGDDLSKLRHDHPAWNFGSVWASASSGPDARRLWASRGGVRLSAWTAAELARHIRREEQASS